ncbi:MAG: STAS domain-containing protein [Gaiellaceae bacterium]
MIVDRSAAVAVVVARGEHDAYSAPDLEAAFADVGAETRVVVDLDSVSFLDSTALGAVVRAVREIDERGGRALVVLPRGPARRIFEITALDSALPVAESRAQALW